jgi:hypothetical protein
MTATKTKKKKARPPLPTEIRDRETPVSFTETFKCTETFKWQREVTFTASSFQSWMEGNLPVIKGMVAGMKNGIEVGDKLFYLKSLPIWYYTSSFGFSFCPIPVLPTRPTRSGLQIYKGRTAGFAYFDQEINIPVLANKSREPWMSLTPNEVLTLRGSVRRTKGNVGIAGLGLGWVARKVLERSKVTHLTIHEIDQSVIDQFGASLIQDFGDRVTIVQGNAYEADWSSYDVSLWDIWDSWGGASWDSKYKTIRDQLITDGKVCIGWGEGVQ